MEDVFDQTFDVFNGEIEDVASDFTDFIAALKVGNEFNVIEGNVETFIQMVQNYTNDIKPSMENALDSIDNITTNILPGIQTSCDSLGSVCGDLNGVLGQSFFQKPLPPLPDDILSNLASFSSILSNVDQEISNVNITGQLSGLQDEINSIRAELGAITAIVWHTQKMFRFSFRFKKLGC